MIDYLLQLDEATFIYLNTLRNSQWDAFWLFVTHKLSWIPLYLILLSLLFLKYNWKITLLILFYVLLLIIASDQLANFFKFFVERPRPCKVSNLSEVIRVVSSRCSAYGFYSAHASNSMALAVFVGLLLKPYYKTLLFYLLFWVVLVSYSRIYVGVHYPLDIVCGMGIGVLLGFLFYLGFRRLKNNKGLAFFKM